MGASVKLEAKTFEELREKLNQSIATYEDYGLYWCKEIQIIFKEDGSLEGYTRFNK